VVPRAGFDGYGKSRLSDRPAVSESLYQLSYLGQHAAAGIDFNWIRAVVHTAVNSCCRKRAGNILNDLATFSFSSTLLYKPPHSFPNV
jgi:hypothetical protein